MQQSEDLRAELETASSIIRILTKRDYETLLKFPAAGTFEKVYQTNKSGIIQSIVSSQVSCIDCFLLSSECSPMYRDHHEGI